MKITVFEFVFTVLLAILLGLVSAGWDTIVFGASTPVLEPLGLKYALSGVWLTGYLLPPLIIRKPGIALLSGIVSATVQASFTHWGIAVMLYGFIEGIGAEAVFIYYRHRRWDFEALSFAALSAAFFSVLLNYSALGYTNATPIYNVCQFITFEVSAVALGTVPAWYIAKQLARTGLLNGFRIVRDYDGFNPMPASIKLGGADEDAPSI